MSKRSYQIAVMNIEHGQQVAHQGYMRIHDESDLSGVASDEVVIRQEVLETFGPDAEYLPMRIPNRQYNRFQREEQLNRFVGKILDGFYATHALTRQFDK